MEKLLYTAANLGELTSLGRSKVYELLQTGEIPSIRVGRAIRVSAKALEEWLERQREQTATN